MKLEIKGSLLEVEREKGDARLRKGGGYGGTAETQLFSHIRRALQGLGFKNVVHKRMWRDGHMVDDHQTYVRFDIPTERGTFRFCIYNGSWALYDAGERLRENGRVGLLVERLTRYEGEPIPWIDRLMQDWVA